MRNKNNMKLIGFKKLALEIEAKVNKKLFEYCPPIASEILNNPAEEILEELYSEIE